MSFVEVGGRCRAGLIAAALIALVCALAMPTAASASVEFEVNGTADEADLPAGGCLTLGGKCTLRAAIEEANASANTAGELDRISFDPAVFDGGATSTIALTDSLPAITDPVRVNGGECLHGVEEIHGPCVGVNGPGASKPALAIANADGVEVLGLAVTGASIGIDIIESEEVRVNGNWLGVKLDGSSGPNTTGIFVDPKSNGDRIGGESPGTGNVFANNSGDGLDILGADETLVLGNYFGVEPDGKTPAANGKDIEVNSQLAGGFAAERNLIGVRPPFSEPPTPECDIGCNVIVGATASGIDLQGDVVQGESPAVETQIAGNFIGLAVDGTTVVPNAVGGIGGAAGVKVGAAAKTIIGGSDAGGNEANFFAGGSFGIYHENADDLQVLNNEIGFNPNGVPVASPGIGMFIFCSAVTEEATIEGNAIGMDAGGVGIEQVFLGATIVDNFIEGGETGILSRGTGFAGNLIQENLIEAAAGNGILIKSDLNLVIGNEVLESGAAGIRVQDTGPPFASPTTENQIGGDSEAEENGIFDSGGDAIEIVDFEATANAVARNFGAGNSGLFIDLVATDPFTEPKGPNDGIEPPAFSTSTQSSASGSGAKEAAVIRVFRKASAASGELESFLAETQADASGNWKVAYPGQIPTGTIVAATQTSKGATSELLTATSTADPVKPKGPTSPGCPAAGPPKCPVRSSPPPPPSPPPTPETTIGKGPKGKSHSTTAKFKFSSSVSGSSFQCKLDKSQFKTCKSPKKYKKLKPGKHVFKVRAVNSAGKADPTPAKRKFTVLG